MSNAKPKTIPVIEALRIGNMTTKIQFLNERKANLQAQLQLVDPEIEKLRNEIQNVFNRNGFAGIKIGGLLTEDENGLPAGTVLQLDGKPIMEEITTDIIETPKN
jgi:hypothetical protein